MAEPLKNYFDSRVPRTIGAQIAAVWPNFAGKRFIEDVLEGYEEFGLMDRGRQIARMLRRHLPDDYSAALEILLRSIGDRPARTGGDGGMASFLYLPHVSFVGQFGLDAFDESMAALYILTQRFTGEFSIRRFIEHDEARSLALLHDWAVDPNAHVRRLVSEGTRPRLPWAGRLRRFQEDPAPVLALLERLKDDSEEFVRRSVANNLNDIGKDHPEVLIDVTRRWMTNAPKERRELVRHALRSLVKQGNPAALEILGFGESAAVTIEEVRITPELVALGATATVEFNIRNTGQGEQRILVDMRVHFVKANGRASPKVFKLKTVQLQPGATASFRKTISLAHLTTRRPYAGRHLVEALVNGSPEPLGSFLVFES